MLHVIILKVIRDSVRHTLVNSSVSYKIELFILPLRFLESRELCSYLDLLRALRERL